MKKEKKMKRKMLFLLLATIVLTVTAGAQTATKKYDIKSGIVTYESVMKMSGMEIKKKLIVYFEDFGMKECKETYSADRLSESFFSDGKDLYLAKHDNKKAFKQGTASRGTELRVEWSEFGTEKERKAGIYKKLPVMTVAGKSCDMFEYNDGKGSITKYGGWNKILLYMDMQTKSLQSTQTAVKVEENVKVPPEKFQIPAGYKTE
jgi:hypothetical protein